jgi:hypothetical protein
LSLDKQNRYPDALKEADRAVSIAPEGSSIKTLAQREKDRLVQLTGGTPAKPATPAEAPKNPAEAPKN